MDIERLRALEKEFDRKRDEANSSAERIHAGGDKDGAAEFDAVADAYHNAGNRIRTLIAELGQEVGAVESFRGSLNSWIMAYPEQCFSEPTPEELFWLRDAKPGLLDRISASMGRHVAKCLIADFDAAFANFTSPAHTSEARGAYITDLLIRIQQHLGVGCVAQNGYRSAHNRLAVEIETTLRNAEDAAMRQEAGSRE